MDKQQKLQLIAPCGIDCFNCECYIDNILPEWIPQYSELFNLAPENVPCKGCRTEKGCKYHGYKCETLDCTNEKAVNYCFECSEFPCSRLQPARDGADKYPHNFKLYNLCRMKYTGIENWIKEAKTIREKYFKGQFIIGSGPVFK